MSVSTRQQLGFTALGSWAKLPSMAGKGVILGAAGTAVAIVVTLAAVDISASHKNLTLSVDGVVRPIATWGSTAYDVLEEASIALGPQDRIVSETAVEASRPHNIKVEDGQRIEVFTARPIRANVDGVPSTVVTSAQSIMEVLETTSADTMTRVQARESGLPLTQSEPVKLRDNDFDGITVKTLEEPALPDDLNPLDEVVYRADRGTLLVEITRVKKELEVDRSEVPHESEITKDPSLFEGEWVREQEGKVGISETVALITQRGNSDPERTILSSVKTEPATEKRTEGTKKVTPLALVEAGIDPAATLEEYVDDEGRAVKRYRAELGSITSQSEIDKIKNRQNTDSQLPQIPLGTYSGEDPRGIAQAMLEEQGLGAEFPCLLNLWERESHWNPYAHNASSGAYGIPQALPGSKMASAGADWQTNPRTQITWGLGYISGRYGSPCGAWDFFQSNNWY